MRIQCEIEQLIRQRAYAHPKAGLADVRAAALLLEGGHLTGRGLTSASRVFQQNPAVAVRRQVQE
jgi:hypothetical protein